MGCDSIVTFLSTYTGLASPFVLNSEIRPAADEAVNTARFKPDKGFSGVDYGGTGGRSGGPVQFEKDAHEAADPFGLDQVRPLLLLLPFPSKCLGASLKLVESSCDCPMHGQVNALLR